MRKPTETEKSKPDPTVREVPMWSNGRPTEQKPRPRKAMVQPLATWHYILPERKGGSDAERTQLATAFAKEETGTAPDRSALKLTGSECSACQRVLKKTPQRPASPAGHMHDKETRHKAGPSGNPTFCAGAEEDPGRVEHQWLCSS